MPLPLVLVVVVDRSFPALKALDVGITYTRTAHTALIARTVLDQAERIRLAFWAEMPSFNVVE